MRRHQLRLAVTDYDPKTIQGRFDKYHDDHPEVYTELVRLARKACKAGKEQWGIGALCEVLRWETALRKPEGEAFKLNNNYRSRYARLIMEQEPDLATFFEVRTLAA